MTAKALLARTASGPPSLGLFAEYWADDGILTAGAVATWKDRTVGGHDLSQVASGKRPIRSATSGANSKGGITFDGVDDILTSAAWSLAQPCTFIYIGGIGGTTNMMAFSGLSGLAPLLYFTGSDVINAGVNGAFLPHAAGVRAYRCYFNGASSALTVNGSAPATGSPGTGASNGLNIGGYYNTGFFNGATVCYLGAYSGDVTAAANWTAFKAWVLSYYGLVLT